MRDGSPRQRVAVIVAVALGTVLGLSTTAAAQQDVLDDEPVDLGVYGAPVRFTAPEGVVIELESGRRLVDTVEFRPSPRGDGMVVIAEMDLHEYVEGIAEMPARWHMEALKAQAVASRTYAWYQASLGTYRNRGLAYDICATTACQVFRGRSVVETPGVGRRWQRAVAQTAGEVLLYEGAPILARYFSTSGGRTRNNEDIFPSSGAFPYLQGIEDPDDAVSPVHTWQATFTRAQFDDLLAQGATLSATVPVAEVEVVREGPGVADRVVVTGRDGTTVEVTAIELRDFLNTTAPAHYPDDFPGPRSDGGSLPTTVPSSRYEVEVTEDRVVLDGSGWGHAVGMGQYGAWGKAQRGLDYVEILSTYYNGLEPTTTDAAPDRLRVGLADDLDELSLTPDGPLTVSVGDTVLTERGFGTWHLQGRSDGTTRLVAPPGHGAPLVAEPTTTTRTRPFPVETLVLETVVNKPAELVVEVRHGGEPVARRSEGVVDRGRRQVEFSLEAEDATLTPGHYEVALLAVDEDGTEAGTSVPIEVIAIEGGTMASVLGDRDPVQPPGDAPPVAAVLVAAAAGVLAGVVVRRRVEVTA